LRRRFNSDDTPTRERIAVAGLTVLDAEGLEGLTVRKVAARLGVGHGALYWHIRSKQDLLDEVAEALLRREIPAIQPLESGEDWAEWLLTLARRLRHAMLAHRDGAAIVATCQSKTRVEMFSVIGDAAATALRLAGFSALDAFDLQLAMLAYTIGLTAQEQSTVDRSPPADAAARFPALTAAKAAGFGTHTDGEALFAAGFGLFLRGAAARRPKPLGG
jgi:TetR/AcrR family transcriptional regulator, tetracycline repressor protein